MFLYIISIRSFEGNFHWSHPGVSPQWRKMFCLKKLKDKTQKHFDVFSTISVTGLGVFLKVLGNKISCKRSPNEWHIFGLFWKTSCSCKHCIGYSLANFWTTLGHFLLQHMVTLSTTYESRRRRHWRGRAEVFRARVLLRLHGAKVFYKKVLIRSSSWRLLPTTAATAITLL